MLPHLATLIKSFEVFQIGVHSVTPFYRLKSPGEYQYLQYSRLKGKHNCFAGICVLHRMVYNKKINSRQLKDCIEQGEARLGEFFPIPCLGLQQKATTGTLYR